MNVRDYILLGDKLCRKIQSSAEAHLLQWSQDWALDHIDVVIASVIPISEMTSEMSSGKMAYYFMDQASAYQAMLQLDTGAIIQLGDGLFGDTLQPSDFQHSRVLHDMVSELLVDLVRRFANKSGLVPVFVESDREENWLPEWFEQGAGTACIQLSVGVGSIALLLPWEMLKHVFSEGLYTIKQTQPLSKLVDALEARSVHGHIVLGEVELTIESLKSLQQGDVLCLDVSLQNPVKLQLESAVQGWSLCGFLGKQDRKQAFLVESVEGQ